MAIKSLLSPKRKIAPPSIHSIRKSMESKPRRYSLHARSAMSMAATRFNRRKFGLLYRKKFRKVIR